MYISAGPFRGHQAARAGYSQQFKCHYVLQSCPDVLPVLSRCHLMYSSSQTDVVMYGQKPGITLSGPRCLSPGSSSESFPGPPQNPLKITFGNDAPRLSKMTPGPPKTTPKSLKIEPGNCQLVFPMLFCRTLVLNDSCMNFIVFQVPGHPRITKKSPKPGPRNILKLYVAISASRSSF